MAILIGGERGHFVKTIPGWKSDGFENGVKFYF